MESLSWTSILIALAGSMLATAIVFIILVMRDRFSQPR